MTVHVDPCVPDGSCVWCLLRAQKKGCKVVRPCEGSQCPWRKCSKTQWPEICSSGGSIPWKSQCRDSLRRGQLLGKANARSGNLGSICRLQGQSQLQQGRSTQGTLQFGVNCMERNPANRRLCESKGDALETVASHSGRRGHRPLNSAKDPKDEG